MEFNSIKSLYEKIKKIGEHWSIDPSKMNFRLEDSRLKYRYINENGKASIKDFFLEITVTHNPILIGDSVYLINFFNSNFHRIFWLKSDTQVVKFLPEFISIVDDDWYSKTLQARCIYEKKINATLDEF